MLIIWKIRCSIDAMDANIIENKAFGVDGFTDRKPQVSHLIFNLKCHN